MGILPLENPEYSRPLDSKESARICEKRSMVCSRDRVPRFKKLQRKNQERLEMAHSNGHSIPDSGTIKE